MTLEEKELLLRDLLPRLQYRVKIQTWYGEIITSDINTFPIGYDEIDIEQLAGMKPYLRPMSSMTKDEKKIQKTYIYHFSGNNLPNYEGNFVFEDEVHEYMDWLNAHHFDYRGLIEKGLALEAPEGMYVF